MSSWTTLGLVLASLLVATHQQVPRKVYSQIPDYLIECYTNQTLYERDMRLPSTMSTLISIVRKIEQYPGINMDIRTFTVTLLRKFRLDGVVRDPNIKAIGIVPFGPTGSQMHRQRFLFDSLLPATGMVIPNETLTSQEKCALHFMLSPSVDEWERGDGSVCGQLNTYKSRRPRSAEEITEGEGEMEATPVAEETTEADKEREDELAMPPKDPPSGEDSREDSREEEKPPEEDVEKLAENGTEKVHVEMHLAPQKSGRLMSAMEVKSGKIITDYPRSDCPVENGVVFTSSGAVSAGNLIAGVATGLQPDTATVSDVVNSVMQSGRRAMSVSNDKITNYWAATLAGDLAEAALYQGPHNNAIVVGARGGWNDTAAPKWYFLSQKDNLDMTDAEIRGGLDGLIIAKKIIEWNNAFGNSLRLSQILDMYYSDRGVSANPSYRACQRKEHFTEVAPGEEMKAQALASSKVLKNVQSYFPIEDDLLKDFSDKAVSQLTSYLPTIDPNCGSALTQNSLTQLLTPSIELVTIIDTSWPYKDALTLISYIIDKINLGDFGEGEGVGGGGGSVFTLMPGKDVNSPLIVDDSTSALDFYGNFTYDVYSKLTPGLDLVQMLTRLRSIYASSMEKARQRRVTTERPQVALFLPYTSSALSDSERTSAMNLFNRLKIKAPNTKFIYLSLGSKEQYSDLVIDKDKDLFQISSISDFQSPVQLLLKRLTQFPRQIINPACTYRWESKGENGNSMQYADPMAGPLFFHLHPNYFFKSEKVTIKFQGQGYGSLNICYSRKNDLTGLNSTSSTNSAIKCKSITTETAEYSESQPCSGSDYIGSCNHMYFSVSATSPNPRCYDTNCRYPDMVRFVVTHEGLTCASGAGGLLLTGVPVALWVILFSVKEGLSRMLFIG